MDDQPRPVRGERKIVVRAVSVKKQKKPETKCKRRRREGHSAINTVTKKAEDHLKTPEAYVIKSTKVEDSRHPWSK